jgi:hypothetical protein
LTKKGQGHILGDFSPTRVGAMLWFLKYFRQKNCEKIGVFCFWEKRQLFRRKLAKISANYDHNIDPLSPHLAELLFHATNFSDRFFCKQQQMAHL